MKLALKALYPVLYVKDAQFGPSEVKLLYILHWIILDAASECEDLETDPNRNSASVQLHSLCTVQLLVYLLAPVIHLLRDSDFQTLKLENGLRFWQPLWDYRQPDIPCFSTPVKPQRNILKAQHNLLKVNTNAANIYIGKGTSRENLSFLVEPSGASRKSSFNDQQSIHAPLARWSDICPISTADSHSVNLEVLCEHCNNIISSHEQEDRPCHCKRKESTETFNGTVEPNLFNFQLSTSVDEELVKQRLASAVTSGIRGPTAPDILSASYFDIAVLRCLFSLHWSEDGVFWALKYIHQRLLEVCDEYLRRDYSERERSQSLPFQDFKLLRSQSIPLHGADKSYGKIKLGIKKPSSRLETIPSAGEISPSLDHKISSAQDTSECTQQAFKKFKTLGPEDIKSPTSKDRKPTFYLSGSPTKEDSHYSQLTNEFLNFEKMRNKGKRYNERIYEQYLTKKDDSSSGATSTQDLDLDPTNKGQKSVSFPPYLAKASDAKCRYQGSDHDSFMTSSHSSSSSSQMGDSSHAETRTGTEGRSDLMSSEDEKQKPMITVSQHGLWDRQRNRNTFDKPMETSNGIRGRKNIFEMHHPSWLKDTARKDRFPAVFSVDDQTQNQKKEKEGSIPRSLTDSDINYSHEEEVHEVPGSVHYIQDNGHLNYKVILQAIHFIALNQATPRVCEVLLNIINCLLDLDIMERKQDVKPPESPENKKTEGDSSRSTNSDSAQEQTAHGLAMDSLFR